jgi:hypothetical protein
VVTWVTSSLGRGNTDINGTSIFVITEGRIFFDVLTFSGLVISFVRPVARIIGTGIPVITVSINLADRRGTLQIGVVNSTSGRVTLVLVALVRRRNGGILARATSDRVTSELDTLISVFFSAISSSLFDKTGFGVTSILVTSIRSRNRDIGIFTTFDRIARTLLTLAGQVTNAVRSDERDSTGSRIARVDSASSRRRNRYIRVDTACGDIASDGLALVGGIANSCVLINQPSIGVTHELLTSIGGRNINWGFLATSALVAGVSVTLGSIIGTTSSNCGRDLSGSRVADVLLTSIRGRNGNISVDTTAFNIARWDLALVRVIRDAVGDGTVNDTGIRVTGILDASIRSRNFGFGEDTSFGSVTRVVLALVCVVGEAIWDSVINYASLRIASVLIAHVTVGNRVLGRSASKDRVASVSKAEICLILAAGVSGKRRVLALVLCGIGGIDNTLINGTQVVVIAVGPVGLSANDASHEESSLDGSSRRLTLEVCTHGVSRNRLSNMRAAGYRITSISETFVSKLALGTNVSRLDFTSSRVTLVGGTLGIRSYGISNMRATSLGVARIGVALVALLARGTNVSRLNSTSGRVALVGGTLSIRSYGISNMRATSLGVARIGVALVALQALGTNVSRLDITSSRVALVGGTHGIRCDRFSNVRAASLGLTGINKALVAKLTTSGGIGGDNGTSLGVAFVSGT